MELRVGLATASGLAIIMVVLYHAELTVMSRDPGSNPWGSVLGTLVYIPVPAFALLSGLAMSAPVRNQRSSDVVATRLTVYIHLYLFWSVAEALFRYGSGSLLTVTLAVSNALHELASPTNHLWFLYALIFCLSAGKLISRFPRSAQMSIALPASILLAYFSDGPIKLVAYTFAFFLSGVNYGQELLRFFSRNPIIWFAATLSIFVALRVSTKMLGIDGLPGVHHLYSGIGIACSIFFSVLLARIPAARWLASVGRSTLPIYVLHSILLTVAWKITGYLGLASLDGVFRFVLPIGLGAVALVGALALRKAALSTPWLFAAPKWFFKLVTPGIDRLLSFDFRARAWHFRPEARRN